MLEYYRNTGTRAWGREEISPSTAIPQAVQYTDGANTPMKLLVIEDEQKTANFLKRGFSEAGFVVDIAPDGVEALRLIQAGSFDLVVLDLLLPGLDGLRVLTWLRESGAPVPVLI